MPVYSALSAIDLAFAELTTQRPTPMFFDARTVPGLPDRPMPLQELRDLLQGHVYEEVTDAVWRQLAAHARAWGREWVTAAAGIAAPSLTKMAARIGAQYPGQIEDIDSELLTGFLDAVVHAPIEPPQMWLRLCWAAWRGGLQAVPPDDTVELLWDVPVGSRLPNRPYGHPDLLLGRAHRAGVITLEAAELISATRWGGELLHVLAAQQGTTVVALRKRRRLAELRLAAALQANGLLPGPGRKRAGKRSKATSQGNGGDAANLSAAAVSNSLTSPDRS